MKRKIIVLVVVLLAVFAAFIGICHERVISNNPLESSDSDNQWLYNNSNKIELFGDHVVLSFGLEDGGVSEEALFLNINAEWFGRYESNVNKTGIVAETSFGEIYCSEQHGHEMSELFSFVKHFSSDSSEMEDESACDFYEVEDAVVYCFNDNPLLQIPGSYCSSQDYGIAWKLSSDVPKESIEDGFSFDINLKFMNLGAENSGGDLVFGTSVLTVQYNNGQFELVDATTSDVCEPFELLR